MVLHWSTLLRTLHAKGVVVGDDGAYKVVWHFFSSGGEGFGIRELLAVVRVMAYGIFLCPAPDISA